MQLDSNDLPGVKVANPGYYHTLLHEPRRAEALLTLLILKIQAHGGLMKIHTGPAPFPVRNCTCEPVCSYIFGFIF